MNFIDTCGTYRGMVVEHSLSLSKSGYPQLVLRVEAVEQWNRDTDAWELVAESNSGSMGWFVLFNDTEVFNAESALKNYEQAKIALGWDGVSFDPLTDGSFVDTNILFRVAEGFNGRLAITWIDAYDASPTRTTTSVDSNVVRALNSKLQFSKPVAAAFVQKKAKKTQPPTKKMIGAVPGCTQLEAWAAVQAARSADVTDAVLVERWTDACDQIGEGKTESEMTPAGWAQIRDLTLTLLTSSGA